MAEEVEIVADAKESTDVARQLERNNLLIVVLGTAAFGFTQDFWKVLSFLAGGIITVVNLRLFRLIVSGLTGVRQVKKSRLLAQVVLKFFGLVGVLLVLLLWVKPAPLPFLLGLSTIVIAITLEGLIGIFRSE